MTILPLQTVSSTPAVRSREVRLPFEQLTETRVPLIALAISVSLLVCAPIGRQHQGLDERTMLAIMLAAGGMPLIYVPPALCAGPPESSRFEQTKLRALLQD